MNVIIAYIDVGLAVDLEYLVSIGFIYSFF